VGGDPLGGWQVDDGIGPIIGCRLDLAGNILRLLRFGRVGQTLGALWMNARRRINGMMADRAAFPLGIKDGGVPVSGKHQGLLVCEHAGRCFDGWPRRGLGARAIEVLTRIGVQRSNTRASQSPLSYPSGMSG
jgi:hypothetical protein